MSMALDVTETILAVSYYVSIMSFTRCNKGQFLHLYLQQFFSAKYIFGRPFVKRFALCSHTVVCPAAVCLSCLSCLSVTLVYCGQTVGWIKMKLGMQVCLGPGHIVSDGTQLTSPRVHSLPIFGPYLLWPNGLMDYDATWYGARPRPRRLWI